MSADSPLESEKTTLQQFYLASRNLLQCGVVPPVCVQRSFEEAIAGFLGNNTWRPTHISYEAARAILAGASKTVQRAHGVLGDRMDRYDRTLAVLQGPLREFDDWWGFYRKHDATVLITRQEHGSNRKFTLDELIEVPWDSRDMFVSAGFAFKVRKKVEMKWLSEVTKGVP